MKSLQDVYKSYQMADAGGDKGTAHSYIDIYGREILAEKNVSLLEIGIWQGHSLKMWADYLPDSRIVGLDIDLSKLIFEPEGFEVLLCDATKHDEIKGKLFGTFDYIIDDGSHRANDQIDTFYYLWHYLKVGGKYFIEDVIGMDIANDLAEKILNFTGIEPQIYDLIYVKGRSDDVLIQVTKIN